MAAPMASGRRRRHVDVGGGLPPGMAAARLGVPEALVVHLIDVGLLQDAPPGSHYRVTEASVAALDRAKVRTLREREASAVEARRS